LLVVLTDTIRLIKYININTQRDDFIQIWLQFDSIIRIERQSHTTPKKD